MLTQAILKENLHYNPDTGVFTWVKTNKGRILSKEVGFFEADGYRRIGINRKRYAAHRLAWLYMTGEWPENQIDHVNGIRGDNRFLNIREANHSQNNHNKRKQSNNTSGYKGVSWYKHAKKWRASIKLDNKTKCIGYFLTAELAYDAYRKAAKELHGDFHCV